MKIMTSLGGASALALLVLFATSQHAWSERAGLLLAEAENVDIELRDARENSVKAVQNFATGASKRTVVLAVFGMSQALYDAALKAARQSVKRGISVRGIVIGPTNVRAFLEIYAGTMYLGRFEHPDPQKELTYKDIQAIENAIADAHSWMIKKMN